MRVVNSNRALKWVRQKFYTGSPIIPSVVWLLVGPLLLAKVGWAESANVSANNAAMMILEMFFMVFPLCSSLVFCLS